MLVPEGTLYRGFTVVRISGPYCFVRHEESETRAKSNKTIKQDISKVEIVVNRSSNVTYSIHLKYSNSNKQYGESMHW
jgi:hypothetical protein